MCGICGAFDLTGRPIPDLERRLEVMNALIAHRGPDDAGVWMHPHGHVGLAHRRLSIIDLEHGHQPMSDERGRWITYNGEIYNYPELRREIGCRRVPHDLRHRGRAPRARPVGHRWAQPAARACSPTRCGTSRPASWSCVRDRFGIKPLYYATVGDIALLRLGGQGAASVPARRSRPTSTRSRTTSPSSSAWPARRCSRASRSCCPATSCGSAAARPARPLLGGLLRDRLRPHRALFRGADRGAARGVGRAAPAQRRAGRGLSQRRP